MKGFSSYSILDNHRSSLKETSKDAPDLEHTFYMTEDMTEVINFDDVKKEYISVLSLSDVPASADALLEKEDGYPIFIEFKNGRVNKQKQYEIQKKVYDSVLIFSDVVQCTIKKLRESAEFILVYNEEANSNNTEIKEHKPAYVQPSGAFDRFAKNIGKLAGDEYVCFKLKQFEKYCFKKVHTYTEKEFENYIRQLLYCKS